MSFWKKLFSRQNSVEPRQGEQKEEPRNRPILPTITAEHLHRDFGEFDESPPSDRSSPRLREAAPYWNKNEYEGAYRVIVRALKGGPNEYEKSCARSLLGMIEVKRGNLLAAVDNLLSCLKIHKRDRQHTWECAMRLSYIYSEAGRSSEAEAVKQLARYANEALGLAHTPDIEREIRNLTKRTVS